MKTKPTPIPAPPVIVITEADIANRAHRLWVQEGYPENRALAHWLEAERQLRANPALRDEAFRLTAEPNDPAASDAAKIDEELDQVVAPPTRRGATSL